MLGGPIGHWPLAKNLWRDTPARAFPLLEMFETIVWRHSMAG